MADNDEKKIIVDEDWKEEAQREKEELIKQEKTEEEAKEEEGRPDLPDADFSALVSMLATQSFMALGLIRMKDDEEPMVDLGLAKFNIDMLTVLEEKTKGNVSDEEKQLLEGSLGQLRMAFVNSSK